MATVEVRRGDTEPIEFVLQRDGVPIDITGYTVFFTVKSTADGIDLTDATGKIKLVNGPGDHIEAAAGRTVFTLAWANTKNFLPDTYVYDVQWVAPDGTVTSCPPQKIKIKADVTQRITV